MQASKVIRTNKVCENFVCVVEFEQILRENALLEFDRVMAVTEDRVIKHAVPERKTGTFILRHRGGIVRAFIKRHFPLSPGRYIRERIRLAPAKTAFDEFENIIAFLRAGIPTMMPIAAGKKKAGIFGSRSFLITEAIEGCMTLQAYAEGLYKKLSSGQRSKLLRRIALLTRKMHHSGFNHRDYYLCHLLIGITEQNRDDLFVVDLHRVDKRDRVPERWVINDLAALCYSSMDCSIKRTDMLRFLKTYLDVEKLSIQGKALALKIIHKTRKMVERAG